MTHNNFPIRFHDDTYLDMLRYVKEHGRKKSDRTGTGTTAIFGYMMRFDISHNVVPLLTTKSMYLPALKYEVEWYLSGDSNIKFLQDNKVRIWNEWADENGDLGPVYGFQWRNWPHMEFNKEHNLDAVYCDEDEDGSQQVFQADVIVKKIDQIQNVIDTLRNNPDSRRIIVSAWNVGQIDEMKLPPCHYTFQFQSEVMTLEERRQWYIVENDMASRISDASHEALDLAGVPRRWLSCLMNQRSADVFLGVPFNISQYSMITALIARTVGMATKDFIWSGGDCHIYDNLQDQVDIQLKQVAKASPRMEINPELTDVNNFKAADITFPNYVPGIVIKGQVAV